MGAPQTSIHFICCSVNAQPFDSMSKLSTSQRKKITLSSFLVYQGYNTADIYVGKSHA